MLDSKSPVHSLFLQRCRTSECITQAIHVLLRHTRLQGKKKYVGSEHGSHDPAVNQLELRPANPHTSDLLRVKATSGLQVQGCQNKSLSGILHSNFASAGKINLITLKGCVPRHSCIHLQSSTTDWPQKHIGPSNIILLWFFWKTQDLSWPSSLPLTELAHSAFTHPVSKFQIGTLYGPCGGENLPLPLWTGMQHLLLPWSLPLSYIYDQLTLKCYKVQIILVSNLGTTISISSSSPSPCYSGSLLFSFLKDRGFKWKPLNENDLDLNLSF